MTTVSKWMGAGAHALLVLALNMSAHAGLLPLMPGAAASAPMSHEADRDTSPEGLASRLQGLQRELDAMSDDAVSLASSGRKRFLLQWQINMLRQHIALLHASDVEKLALGSIKSVDANASADAASGGNSWRLDRLRAELQWRSDEVKQRESDVRVLAQLIEAGQARVAQEAKTQRQIEDRLGGRTTPTAQAQLLQDRELSQLTQQGWRTLLDLHEAKKKVQQQRLQLSREALKDNEDLLQRQADGGTVAPEELTQILSINDKRRQQVEQQIGEQGHAVDRLRAQIVKLGEQELVDDRELDRLRKARGAAEHQPQADTRLKQMDQDIASLNAGMAARQSQRKLILAQVRTSEISVDMLGMMLNALALERTFWERKADTAAAANGDLKADAFGAALTQFASYEKLVRSDLELVQFQLARELLQAEPGSAPLITTSRDPLDVRNPMIDEFRKRQGLYTETLSTLVQIRRMLERRMDDFDVSVHEQSGTARLNYWRTELLDQAAAVWRFELFNVDDKLEIDGQTLTVKRGVTVGKVLTAILLVTLGSWVASRLMVVAERVAIARLGMQPTSARIARRWLFVLIMIVLATWSLTLVRIPLTAFAFLGGAVAIGVGFGTQNLLKNLISGVMIMGERPMRPGDWIEVGTLSGEVTDINLRATIIRDVNGIETLIPNSTFVEQNVTNWTLSNRMVRRGVQVGVAYGSPTRKVAELLEAVATRHGVICQTPPPEVLFESFGDSALMFGVYFWLEMRPGVASRQVLSDLRYMIDKSFAENGIVIAYPQRDVHIDTSRPLVVQLNQQAPVVPAAS